MTEDKQPEGAEVASKADSTTSPKKKSKKTLWIVIGVIVVFFLVIPGILLAVGGSILKDKLDDPTTGEQIAEGLIENATGTDVNVDANDGSYTVESKDGAESISVGSNQKIPDDFPKDITQYLPEKSIVFVLTSENEGKKSWSVTTVVDKTYEEAVAHFKETITSPSYTDTSNFTIGETTTFYGKKDNKTVSITVSRAEDTGDVSVSYLVLEEN
jgi:ABC-type Na+ efflux pump permease subunit